MEPSEQQAFIQLQTKLAQSEVNTSKMAQAVSLFQKDEEDNLVKWQLDIEATLQRIERLLRKQIPKRDNEGNLIFVDCKENELFNEYGVNEMMNLLAWYVNKEVILSNYEDWQIDKIMEQFSYKLISFIYTNMEKFGMDTLEKQRHYPMICMNVVNIVDATYRRALDGLERDSFTKRSIISQTEPLGKFPQYPQVNKKRFNVLNPKTWQA